MNNGLPKGWVEISLDEVGTWQSGGTPSRRRAEFFGKGIPWLKSGDLPDGPVQKAAEEITQLGLQNSSAKLMPVGTVSMALYGATIGKLGILTFPAATNQACANVIADKQLIDTKYLFFYLFSERQVFIEQGQGGAQPNISQEIVRAHPIRLAPIPEQTRIVAKLEMLLAKVDDCQESLARIPVFVKRFRQSVLSAACSGRLTNDWRKDSSHEDGSPVGWKRVPLEELLPPGGIFDGPFGSNLKTSDYTDSGVRVIRLENIGNLRFISEKETYVSREKYRTLKKHTVAEGDIIFASFIDEEIRVCVLPALNTAAIAKADCFCLRPRSELVDRRYLTYQLASWDSYNALVEDVHGATRPRINTTQLRKLEVKVCPLAEQQEIVRRVQSLFALADTIEGRYKEAQQCVDRLSQSILAIAFQGKLVPTEAALAEAEGRSFESAEQLLQRLRRANGNQGASNQSSRKGRAKKAVA